MDLMGIDHHHICSTETVLDSVCKADLQFHSDEWFITVLSCLFDLGDVIFHVIIHGFEQFIRIIIRYRSFGSFLQIFIDEVLCHRMPGTPLCCEGRFFVRKLLLQQ